MKRLLSPLPLLLVLLALACAAGGVAACAGNGATNGDAPGQGQPGGGNSGLASTLCVECTTSADCKNGEVCAQFEGDTFCAATCPNENECNGSTACMSAPSYAGDQVSVCVPTGDLCGSSSGPGSTANCDAGSASMSTGGSCGSLVPPTTPAGCQSCTSSSKSSCQANGCYGGWYCDTSDNKCREAPSSCTGMTSSGGGGTCTSTGSSGGMVMVDAGGPVSGAITGNGGSVSRLLFAVVGDTRPANEDDTSGYPTAIIDQIFSDIAAMQPQPSFTIATGDYQFASTSGSESAPQLAMYLAARAKYSGPFFPAMGNHECTGATASNCGPNGTDGITPNYSNFLSMFLGPVQQTSPYYSINVNAQDGSWTSKFVFIAANAWDSAQSSWLTSVLATKTTYTFIVRHEATGTSGPPGVSPSDSIIASASYTLLIVGHTHTYEHRDTQQIIIGNGGAPLSGSGNYGFGLIGQRSDGALTVDVIDYQTGMADGSFHFVITPGGTLTQ